MWLIIWIPLRDKTKNPVHCRIGGLDEISHHHADGLEIGC